MKKIIIAISIIAALGLNINAQNYQHHTEFSDGFFSTSSISSDYRSEITTPNLPSFGAYTNIEAVPLGSGLLILAGLGAAYAVRRKKE